MSWLIGRTEVLILLPHLEKFMTAIVRNAVGNIQKSRVVKQWWGRTKAKNWGLSVHWATRKSNSDYASPLNTTPQPAVDYWWIALGAMLVTALMLIMSENYQVSGFWLRQTLTYGRMKGLEHFVESDWCLNNSVIIRFRRTTCIKTKTPIKQLSDQQLELEFSALPAVMDYFLFTVWQIHILWLIFF